MRESNFSFPAQNRACVCISSQLYDRRALDTTSPLPLLNSLTHLTYLTSTSPRIREILTCDGGLERLVRILRDFCLSPPPPDNPSLIYGLSPPSLPRPPPPPTLNPKSFDRHAAYRFSLAFQCVVNIGVRGSEPIRSRVVQAGTLDVVGCVLEAWLASKGFAVGPSSSASGMPRETREQRLMRRQQQNSQRQREQAQEIARLLTMQRRNEGIGNDDDDEMIDITQDGLDTSVPNSDAETSASTDNSANVTPIGSGTPTSHVVVPGRDRSGTVVGRPIWDNRPINEQRAHLAQAAVITNFRAQNDRLASGSTSRPETETEDDGDQDADGDAEMTQDQDVDENIAPPPPRPQLLHFRGRRTVGIVSDSPPPTADTEGPTDSLEVDIDAHIIINTNTTEMGMGGVEDGIVALEQNANDDLAMGAPPGAPGAIDGTPRVRQNTITLMPLDGRGGIATVREDMTPRAVLANLPIAPHLARAGGQQGNQTTLPHALRSIHLNGDATNIATPTANAFRRINEVQPNTTGLRHHHHHHRHHHHAHSGEDPGPFREEDVLLSLQLLAYLSKYPHVRQAFYKQRVSFHPTTASPNSGLSSSTSSRVGPSTTVNDSSKRELGFFKSLTGRGKEKAPASPNLSSSSSSTISATPPIQMTNVFSLVERFTFRPSPTESHLPVPPPFLPPEIQYWAGVIMRNACRKDDSRGGIRQCANMLCGKWESFPREFAKCRRCRKAKYCGKECQSKAWSEGHRFWCSAREGDDETHARQTAQAQIDGANPHGARIINIQPNDANLTVDRRGERERGRQQRPGEASPSGLAAGVEAMLFAARSMAQGRFTNGESRQALIRDNSDRSLNGNGPLRLAVTRTESVRPIRNNANTPQSQSSTDVMSVANPIGEAYDNSFGVASGSSSGSSSIVNSNHLVTDVIYSTGPRRRGDTITREERDISAEGFVQPYLPYVRREPFRPRAEFVSPFVSEAGQSDEDRIILDTSDLNVDMVSMRDNGGDDMVLG